MMVFNKSDLVSWSDKEKCTFDNKIGNTSYVAEYLCPKWPRVCSVCRKHNPVHSSFMTYNQVCNKSNTTGVKCGAGTEYPSWAHKFTPDFFYGVRAARSLVFCVNFCRLLFVHLSLVSCLLTIALSFLLRFTVSDNSFGSILKQFQNPI